MLSPKSTHADLIYKDIQRLYRFANSELREKLVLANLQKIADVLKENVRLIKAERSPTYEFYPVDTTTDSLITNYGPYQLYADKRFYSQDPQCNEFEYVMVIRYKNQTTDQEVDEQLYQAFLTTSKENIMKIKLVQDFVKYATLFVL